MSTMKLLSLSALVLGCAGFTAASAAPIDLESPVLVAGSFIGRPPTFGHKAPDPRYNRKGGELAAFEGRPTTEGVSGRRPAGSNRMRYRPPTKR